MSSSRTDTRRIFRANRTRTEPRILALPPELTASPEDDTVRRREAVEAGYRQGYEEGEAAAVRRLADELTERCAWLTAQGEAMRQARHDFLRGAEEEVLDLVVTVVSKMFNDELRQAPALARDNLRHALLVVADRKEISIRVSPDALDRFQSLAEELAGGGVSTQCEVRWIPDQRVSEGGIVVETEAGKLDATIDTQLDEAAAVFREVLYGGND